MNTDSESKHFIRDLGVISDINMRFELSSHFNFQSANQFN